MKVCTDIYQEMLSTFETKTGFAMEDSADLAVRFYATATQLESLYAYCDWALSQSFPQTAVESYLDYHGQLRGLTRDPGVQASGVIRFGGETSRTSDLSVPEGTVCTTAGEVRFVTTQAATLAVGDEWVDVSAQAEAIGTAGNVASGTILWMTQAPVGILTCTNPYAFSGGTDGEDDDTFRQRILDSFSRLPNGANSGFYLDEALSFDGVDGATVIPRKNGVGTVGVVIATSSGLPSDDLVAQVQTHLDDLREIAVDVEVTAPDLVSFDLDLTIYPKSNTTFDQAKAQILTALEDYFTGERLGESVLLTQLYNLIYATDVVENYRINSPTGDLAMALYELPVLGEVTISEGE